MQRLVQDFPRAYKLLDLIIQKYGPDKIETGITLTAHWLQFSREKVKITREQVEELVFLPASEVKPLEPLTAELLRQLYGMKSRNDFYTDAGLEILHQR